MLVLRSSDPLDQAIAVLKTGGIIAYPTETYYALGVDPWNQEARKKLYLLKARDPEKELPLIAADVSMVEGFCETADPRYAVLTARFWPGPLTLVLPARAGITAYAVRVSLHPIARKLSAQFGKPIVSTSANPSGQPAVRQAEDVALYFREGIDVLIDGAKTAGGRPTTIVSLVETPARILREGAIPARDIFALI